MARIVPFLQLAQTEPLLHLTPYTCTFKGRLRIFLHKQFFARHYSLPPRQPSLFGSLATSLGWLVGNYMTWVCSRSNACSDWLILGHYSPVMHTGRLRACKSLASHADLLRLVTWGGTRDKPKNVCVGG